MAIYLGRWGWGLGLAGVLVWGEANLFGSPTLAQITPDSTLGAESSVVTPNVNLRGFPAERIDGGAVRGANLFHSFQEFNIGDGQRVYFANPTGIENILSRVTGNNFSNILGTLGVDGGANLFLLNPNGIIFGPNVQLDIAGSFVASTANSVVFGNGYQFSAKNPQAPPLLTVSVPLGVQYRTNQPKTTIINTGNLTVGQNLTLDAGNLDLQGQLQAGNNLTLQAQDTVKIRDSVTNPFVASASGQLLVQGNQKVDIFALNHPNSGLYSGGDMVLRSANAVGGDAHYSSGGNFRVEKLDGSLGDLESPGDPVFEVAGDYNVANYTGASLQILAGGSVTIPGTITINGAGGAFNNSTVTLSNGTPLIISGTTRPTVDIRAGTTTFFGTPTPGTPTSANITISNIQINAANGLVFLTNQYQPNTTLPGNIQVRRIRTGPGVFFPFSGNSGDIIMDSRGDIIIPEPDLNGVSTIRTDTNSGKVGDITFIANGSFFMRGGAQMAALTFGQGTPGNINILAGNAVSLTGDSVIVTDVQPGGGKGGDINIQAGSLSVTNGSQLISVVRQGTPGNAGNININIRDTVTLSGAGSGVYSSVGSGAVGNGGNINIQANSLSIDDSAGLQAGTSGQGNAGSVFVQVNNSVSLTNGGFISSSVRRGGVGTGGSILINAPASVSLSGFNAANGFSSALLANTGSDAIGQAGSIVVNTGTFRVANGAIVDTSTFNSSNGGSLAINANNLELIGGGQILAHTRSSGTAGNTNLNIADTVNISGSDPTVLQRFIQFGPNVVTNEADASGIYAGGTIFGSTGNGGNLSITARQLNVSNKGAVTTTVFGTGRAGDLAIATTDSVNVSSRGSITSSSTQGNSGKLSISTRQLNVSDEQTVITTVSGKENAGDLSIIATDSLNVVNGGIITTSVGTSSTGNGANLSISTGRLNVSNEGQIITSSFGRGNSGNLSITATDSVNVSDGGFITTGTERTSTGNGGILSISTRQLEVKNKGKIETFSAGTGTSGDLLITATDSINIVNHSLLSASPLERGTAGNTLIETGRLSIRDGSAISSSTLGAGNAGDVTIRATDSIEVLNSSKLSSDTFGSGNGGNLNIETNTLSIRDSEVSTGTLRGSSGKGGTLRVNANDAVEISGVGGLVSATLGQGKGGDIQLSANSLSLTNGGSITSLSDGQDKAGNIAVNLRGDLSSRGGNISASSLSAGGGNIDITADNISLRDSSLISTSVFDSTGGGGNITINSKVFLAIEDSDILANAQAGPGGNITINSSGLIADLFSSGAAVAVGRNPGDFTQFRGNGRNDISVSLAASSRSNGRVDISTASATGSNGLSNYSYRDPTQGAATLPSNLVDAEGLIDRRCAPNNNAKKSSFTITGRGGLPPNPTDPLTNDAVWVDWITLQDRQGNVNGAATDANPTHSQPTPLVEAQSWVIGSDGQVILTAAAPTVTPASSGLVVPSCEDNQAATP